MKNKSQNILKSALSYACVLSVVNTFPINVMAEPIPDILQVTINGETVGYSSLKEGWNSAIASEEAKITLLQDFNLNESLLIPASSNVTLDLNGNTITGLDETTKSFSLISNKGKLTLLDSSEEQDGKISLSALNNNGWNRYSSVISNEQGEFIMDGGYLVHEGGTDMSYAIDNLTNGNIGDAVTIINGGIIESSYRAVRMFANSSTKNNKLEVFSGKFIAPNKAIWLQSSNTKANIAELTIHDGDIDSLYVYAPQNGDISKLNVSINKDAIEAQDIYSYLGSYDYKIGLENDIYTIVETKRAEVNDVQYKTFEEAWQVAVDTGAERITLLEDVQFAGVEGTSKQTDLKGILIEGATGNETITFINAEGSTVTGTGTFINANLKNLNVVDKTFYQAQNGENAWEFTYLEFGGDSQFEHVNFEDGIMFEGENAVFKDCTFTGRNNRSSELGNVTMYGAWITKGEVIIESSLFTGTRGLKVANIYSDSVPTVTVSSTTFDNLTEKPGVVADGAGKDLVVTLNNNIYLDKNNKGAIAVEKGASFEGADKIVGRFTEVEEDGEITYFENPLYEVETILNANAGKIEGFGQYYAGQEVTLTVVLNRNYDFVEWRINGEKVSDKLTYTFIIEDDITVEAIAKLNIIPIIRPSSSSSSSKNEPTATETLDKTTSEIKETLSSGSEEKIKEIVNSIIDSSYLDVELNNQMNAATDEQSKIKEIKFEDETEVAIAVLSDAELADAANGKKDIKITLDIKEINSGLTNKEEESVKSVIPSSHKIGAVLDIELNKVINNKKTSVDILSKEIGITIAIPADLLNKNNLSVVRTHESANGTLISDVLETTNNEDGTLTFFTDRFSTYALTYSDLDLSEYSNFGLNVYENSRIVSINSYKEGFEVFGYMWIDGVKPTENTWREIVLVNIDDNSKEKAYRINTKAIYNTFLNKNMYATKNGTVDLSYANYRVEVNPNSMLEYTTRKNAKVAKGAYYMFMRISDGKNSYLFPLKDVTLSDGSNMETSNKLPKGFKVLNQETRQLVYTVE